MYVSLACCHLVDLVNLDQVEMLTTATYDKRAGEWIINTPRSLAQKYWITNGAVHAQWSVVFAQ